MVDLQRFCFCEKEDGWARKAITQPWSEGGYTYASQGHILLRVPRLDNIPENSEAPKISGGDLAGWLEKEPVAGWHPVPVCKVEKIKCPDCNGQKELYGGPCEDCDGTGEVIDDDGVQVGDAWFTNWLLEMLNDLPNCEIGVNDKLNPCRIRFDGGDGLLMPRNDK